MSGLAGCGGSSEPPPAVILIVVDTLRADLAEPVVGPLATPTIERLEREGVDFPLAFSHAPMTLPAHTALFASRPPHATGVLNNGQSVPAGVPLLAEHLRAHGYATRAVIAIATLRSSPGESGEVAGLARGFDRFESASPGFIASGEQVNARLDDALEGLDPERPFFLFAHFADPHEPYDAHLEQPKTAEVAVDGGAPETVVTSNLSAWTHAARFAPGRHRVEIRSPTKFRVRTFRVVELDGPDTPESELERLPAAFTVGGMKLPVTEAAIEFEVPAGTNGACHLKLTLCDHPARAKIPERYGREVEYVDDQLRRLLETLRARGLLEHSILVFTADHGEALADRTKFIGHVHTLYDELTHVPLVIRPLHEDQARRLAAHRDEIVGHEDVVPTLLELLGLPPLPGQQGRSLLADPPPSPAVLSETRRPEAHDDLVSLRDGAFKLIYHADEDRFEMFDLAADPGERVDVFAQRRAERPDWEHRLRTAAAQATAVEAVSEPGTLDEATIEDLKALGYLGDE